MTAITPQDASTAPNEPRQVPDASFYPWFAQIALGVIRDRLDEITARQEATDAGAAALSGRDGGR